jgi:cytochrome P450 family 142 subfamily A polypeptide 1
MAKGTTERTQKEIQVSVDCNFIDPASWDEKELLERMKWLRQNDPVYWSETTQLWIISKLDDATQVSKNQEVFTSAQGIRPKTDIRIGLIDEGEPRHGQLRSLINRGFTPRMVTNLEPVFRQITNEALDLVAGKGRCDFVPDIAVPLPLLLIADMIGIRREDRSSFHRWSDDLIASDGNRDDPEIMGRAGQAFLEFSRYVKKIVDDRRANPRDDLVSILTGAKDEGLLEHSFDRPQSSELAVAGRTEEDIELAADELVHLLLVLMVAGNETTRNGISGGMQLLIENPAERQKLLDDPSLIPSAVEEMVRLASPVRSFGRTLTQDATLRDKRLREGQELMIVYPSVNRDEEFFEDATAFRVDRNPQHLGFGIGSHFCLGANLARMEMRVAFEELLNRLPDMEYEGGGPEFRLSTLVRTCSSMKVKFTPEAT